MLHNYLILAFRNLVKNNVFAFINIVGLAVALASTFFILIFVVNEFSYDDCHLKNERIYKVVNHKIDFGVKIASAPYIFTPVVRERFPEIEKIARTRLLRDVKIKYNDQLIEEKYFRSADQDIFDIFTLPIILGTNNIEDKNSIVISESIAKKYFGDINPIEQTLEVTAGKCNYVLKIVGVMKDVPQNSTVKATIIGNSQLYLEHLKKIISYTDPETDWHSDFWRTYILLKENSDVNLVESGFRKIVDEFYPKDVNSKEEYQLKNLKDVYFNQELVAELHGNLGDVYLYLVIGFIILLIAVGNYTILSSAISNNRAKEIGIRKTIGASKKNLVSQFLGESIVMTLLALICSLILIKIFYPFAQKLFDYDFNILISNYISYALIFLFITGIIGICAGLYVAVYLSSLDVTEIVKNNLIIKNKGKVRKVLMLVQFVAFIILVFSSIIIYKQHKLFLNKDLGFNKNNLLFVNADFDLSPWINGYIDKISSSTTIESVSSAMYPIPSNNSASVLFNKYDDSSQKVKVELYSVGPNFIETVGLKIVEGKCFPDNDYSRSDKDIIFNRTAIEALGIKEPIGLKIEGITITGIFNEFNFHSLHSKNTPLGISLSDPKYFNTIIIKYKEGAFKSAIDCLKNEWTNFTNNVPFEYETIEEIIIRLYEDEEILFNIVSFFTILAILLSASGLFGLTLFTIKKRTKEIGIRRVLGASFNNIMFILSKEYIALIIIANLIALPFGYYLMNKWLQDFAYKIELGMLPFILSTIIVIVIGLGAISFQTGKAAIANPVESLRDE